MAYYLKKTKLKGRTYLSIDESFYSSEKKGTAHRCYQSLGSVETWKQKGLADPISHFQLEVDALNQEKADKGVPKYPASPRSCTWAISPLRQSLKNCMSKNTWIILISPMISTMTSMNCSLP